jgi:hypothetical protein
MSKEGVAAKTNFEGNRSNWIDLEREVWNAAPRWSSDLRGDRKTLPIAKEIARRLD